MAGVEDGEVQGAAAVKKGGWNLDTRARFGRRGAGITAVTLRGVARPGMAEKKGVTGGAEALVGGDWDAGDARERAERLTGWPALSVGDARARRGAERDAGLRWGGGQRWAGRMARGRPGKRTLGWATRGGAAGYTAPAEPGGVGRAVRGKGVCGLGWCGFWVAMGLGLSLILGWGFPFLFLFPLFFYF